MLFQMVPIRFELEEFGSENMGLIPITFKDSKGKRRSMPFSSSLLQNKLWMFLYNLLDYRPEQEPLGSFVKYAPIFPIYAFKPS